MADVIKTTFQLKRGLATAWRKANPILAPGEPGWTLDTRVLKVGDGVTPWNKLVAVSGEEIPEERIEEAVKNYLEQHPIELTPKVDNKTIGLAVDGVLTLLNSIEAQKDSIPTIDENGSLKWIVPNEISLTINNIPTTFEKVINNLEKEIQKIYTPATLDGLTPATGVLVDEIHRLELSIPTIDNDTIKENEAGTIYVAKISTDILEQGEQELILTAGDSSFAQK